MDHIPEEIMEKARGAYWSNCETLEGQIEAIARAILEARQQQACAATVELSSEAWKAIAALPPNSDGRPHFLANGLKAGVSIRYPAQTIVY